MTKEMTSAEKGRRTKLSQKSVDELINIIVRKDDIARRTDKYVSVLKVNLKALEKKIKDINEHNDKVVDGLYKDNNAAIKRYENIVADQDNTIYKNNIYISKLEDNLKYAVYSAAGEAVLLMMIIIYMILF